MPRPRLAKLTPPLLHHCVPRPRAFAQLQCADPAIWLHGPPGSGKTTLVASYLRSQGIKPLWFKVDADDRDPSTFFHYLAQLHARPNAGKSALPALESASRADWLAFARRFARAFYAALPAGSALVLDNVQESGNALDDILAVLCAERPEDCRLVFISHRAPPAALAGALTSRQLAVLNGDVLRLDRDESAALARSLGMTRGDEIERACEMAQGWPAGIVLLAGHRHGNAVAELPIAEYVARHVLDGLVAPARHVLMSCAFLPDFSAGLARDASGDANAGEVLAGLQRDGFLIEQRGSGAAKTYSPHSLLAEALKAAHGEPGSATRCAAQERAGRLLVQAGESEAGIALLLEAGAHGDAARAILGVARAMLASDRAEQLVRWIATMPDAERCAWLDYWRAIATVSFDEFEARKVFSTVHERFAREGDRVGMVLAAATALAAIDTSWQNYNGIDVWVSKLEDAWRDDLVFPDAEAELRAIAGVLVAVIHGSRLHDRASVLIERLPALFSANGAAQPGLDLGLYAGYLVLDHYRVLREFDRGLLFVNLVDGIKAFAHARPVRLAHWLLSAGIFEASAGIALDRAALRTRAAQRRKEAAVLAERYALSVMRILLAHTEAEAAIQERDLDAATAALDRAEPSLLPGGYWQLAWQHSRRARIALLRAQPADARDHIAKAIASARSANAPEFAYAPYHQSAAISAAWLDDHASAKEHIARAIAMAGDGLKRVFRLTEKLILALPGARTATDEGDAAIGAFVQALHDERINEFGNLMRPLIAEVLAAALARNILVPLAQSEARQRKLQPPLHAGANWPWPVRIETLGGFAVALWSEPLVFAGKSQAKPIEMLKLLVARGLGMKPGKALDIGSVIDELWPDAEARNPKGLFDITLHRLRKLLKVDDAVLVSEGQIRLNAGLVWCDAFQFEQAAAAALGGAPFDDELAAGREAALRHAIGCYGGALFGGEETVAWAFAAKERLAARFTLLVGHCGELLEARGDYASAIAVYEQGLARNAGVEPFYRGLMRCHLARGETAEAVRAYRRCRDLLAVVMGIAPATETQNLLRQIEPFEAG
jgi:LuxR family maltose regulon positive regulatory protein